MTTPPTPWPWPHFSFEEMACRGTSCCGHTYACQPQLMDALEALRAACGDISLPITSGYRCQQHNAAVGGHPNSGHLQGLAADISAEKGSDTRELILIHARTFGFMGIGRGGGFLHIDMLTDPPRPNVWTY